MFNTDCTVDLIGILTFSEYEDNIHWVSVKTSDGIYNLYCEIPEPYQHESEIGDIVQIDAKVY